MEIKEIKKKLSELAESEKAAASSANGDKSQYADFSKSLNPTSLPMLGVRLPDLRKLAKEIAKDDYKKFDYIIAMEQRNIRDIYRIVVEDKDNKIYRLLDFTTNPRDISDPWYTHNFEITYNDIIEGLEAFWNFLKK